MKKALIPTPKDTKSALVPLPYDECFKTGKSPFLNRPRLGAKSALYSFWRITKRLSKIVGAKDIELLEDMVSHILDSCYAELLETGKVKLPLIGTLYTNPNSEVVVRLRCDRELSSRLNTPKINNETFLRNARVMRNYET